ncbi:MAG TPA: hypothetical protein VKT80_03630 [Chloroflexota bacterium]|nr:hypothetical protein [Chloroflexota bacterium]
MSGPIQLFVLWSHALAAAAWIGGSLFFAAALNPAMEQLGRTPERIALMVAANREFREVVRLSILVFLVTGGVLVFTRLGWSRIPNIYVAVLVFKAILSLVMFWLTGRIGVEPRGSTASPGRRVWWLRPQYLILELGVVVYALSIALRLIYQDALIANPGS